MRLNHLLEKNTTQEIRNNKLEYNKCRFSTKHYYKNEMYYLKYLFQSLTTIYLNKVMLNFFQSLWDSQAKNFVFFLWI